MQKLISQLDLEIPFPNPQEPDLSENLDEEKATLLFILDTLTKHLIETENYPARKTRETLDSFTKDLIRLKGEELSQVLFRFRQFYSKYRIDECSYMESTFEEFKSIVWDFADQLKEDLSFEDKNDKLLSLQLQKLRDAVEANSIQELKNQSREFIDSYMAYQANKENRNHKKIAFVEHSLTTVKRKLSEAHLNLQIDHMTKAANKKGFEEFIKNCWNEFQSSKKNSALILLDIDHFKKVNDTYGHDVGDFIIKECVKLLKEEFPHKDQLVARIGGEEFSVLLSGYKIENAADKGQRFLERLRKEFFLLNNHKLQFTVSVGVSQLGSGESLESWIKRTDEALYASKKNGRNQMTLSKFPHSPFQAA
jgi:diguanylate cyclase (GGDEF)-like protein